MEILFNFVANVRVIESSLAKSAIESPILMENLPSIIGFICCSYYLTTNNWNSVRILTLRSFGILKIETSWSLQNSLSLEDAVDDLIV